MGGLTLDLSHVPDQCQLSRTATEDVTGTFQGLHSVPWCWPEFLTDFCQKTLFPHHRDFSIEPQVCPQDMTGSPGMSKSKRES